MKKHFSLHKCLPFVFAVAIATVSISDSGGQSRTPAVGKGLMKTLSPIHRALTLRDLLKTLSHATSIQIAAPVSLLDRRMTFEFTSDTAENLLNNVCELNGWVWSETEPGRILITRKPPRSGADLFEQITAAMPLDVLEYTGARAILEPSGIPKPADLVSATVNNPAGKHALDVANLAREKTRSFRESLPTIENGQPVKYTSLTDEQKLLLIDVLWLDAMREVAKINTSAVSLPDYVRSPSKAEIALRQGNVLFIGSNRTVNGYQISSGFPTVIPGLKPEPVILDPKLQSMLDELRTRNP